MADTKRLLGPSVLLLTAALAGCSASGNGADCAPNCPAPNGGSGGSAQGGSGGSAGSGADTGGGSGGSLNVDSGLGTGGAPVGQVFGHSPDTLYELEPFSKSVVIVGTFGCLTASGGEMWDIAVDAAGNMVGVASTGLASGELLSIDPTSGQCLRLATGSFPNSLAYVPQGVLDPNAEVLVGYNRSDYVRIDPVSGSVTKIGSLNPNSTGTAWEASGDIVSLQDGGTYVTVRPLLSGAEHPNDAVVEVDPLTGQALRLIGQTGFPKLWGLGFWAGTAYGFSANGVLVSIDLVTGAGTTIPMPNVPAGLSFWGAGTTTAAPIVPPR